MEQNKKQIDMKKKKEEMIKLIKNSDDRPMLLITPKTNGGSCDYKQIVNNIDGLINLVESTLFWVKTISKNFGVTEAEIIELFREIGE